MRTLLVPGLHLENGCVIVIPGGRGDVGLASQTMRGTEQGPELRRWWALVREVDVLLGTGAPSLIWMGARRAGQKGGLRMRGHRAEAVCAEHVTLGIPSRGPLP